MKDDLIEEILETKQEDKKVECDCPSHEGKEFLSNVYSLSVDKLYDCLFNTESEFNKAYLAANKFSNLKAEEWKDDCRKLEYNVDVGAFGKTNNIEQQKILKKIKNECYVIVTEVTATGVMYADCMTIITKFCITKFSSKTSKLNVSVKIEYKKKPNLMSRGIIERNTFSNMKSCFEYIGKIWLKKFNFFVQILFLDKNLILLNPDFKTDEKINEPNENKHDETELFRMQEASIHNNGFKIFNWQIEQTQIIYSIILIIFLFFIFNLRLYFRINRTEDLVLETLKATKIK